jgi:hypothetical protein
MIDLYDLVDPAPVGRAVLTDSQGNQDFDRADQCRPFWDRPDARLPLSPSISRP